MNYDYEADLNRLKEAQKNAAVADLEKTRNQALSDLNAEQQKNTANFNSQRSTANAQNRLGAKNFQEYLASTGRANSGLGSQAKMQYDNNLNTSLNSIYGAENAAKADINRRTTDANNNYNSGLASANSTIEANYIQSLLNERQKAFERQQAELNRQLQERQFAESIRQFNENMALQREQLASRFISGSGGGGSTRSYSGTNRTNSTSSTKKSNNNTNNDVAISSVSSPAKFSSTKATEWYVKNAQNISSKNQLDSVIASGLSKGTITKKDAKNIYKTYGINV